MELDSDQYPTDETLEEIQAWSFERGYHNLMLAIERIYPPYGRMEYRSIDDTWEVATGGWSGCESIIAALHSNIMFKVMCWQLSKRGGYYEYTTTPEGAEK